MERYRRGASFVIGISVVNFQLLWNEIRRFFDWILKWKILPVLCHRNILWKWRKKSFITPYMLYIHVYYMDLSFSGMRKIYTISEIWFLMLTRHEQYKCCFLDIHIFVRQQYLLAIKKLRKNFYFTVHCISIWRKLY